MKGEREESIQLITVRVISDGLGLIYARCQNVSFILNFCTYPPGYTEEKERETTSDRLSQWPTMTEKTRGPSFREAIWARVTVCRRKKINHFQKPRCSKSWFNATILSAKYSIWQKPVMEKHKGNFPNWPGQKVYSSIIFCESSLRVWFRQFRTQLIGWTGFKWAKHKIGWAAVWFGAVEFHFSIGEV